MIETIKSRLSSDPEKKREKDTSFESETWKLLFTTVGLGLFFILLAALVVIREDIPWGVKLKDYTIAAGAGLLIAGACFCIGSLLGFLFGIPRVAKAPDQGDEDNARNAILQNDNLVEISDWITKIIVGVGLTQLHQIGPALMSLGEQLAKGIEHHQEEIANITVVIVLYFVVIGFICAYLWTRLYFAEMLNNRIKRLSQELKQREETLGLKEAELEKKDIRLEKKKDEVQVLREIFNDPIAVLKNKIVDDNPILNDPHKGGFGSKPENNGRKMSAVVTQSTFDADLFVVSIEVISTDANKPLTGTVDFHLHPTFADPVRQIAVIQGKAQLRLIAYGAFTVGAVCDGGETRLELDLATLAAAPKLFKER